MAAFADQLYTFPYVYTPVNLTSFLHWANTAEEAELDAAIQVIHIVEHRMPPHPLLGMPQTAPVVIARPDLDRRFVVREEQCQVWGCRRCTIGCGGYQFRWIGPWTCPASIGDETTCEDEVS